MLGAYIGGLLNIISVVRAVLFLYKDKLKTDNRIWLVSFITLYFVCYILTFTVFDKTFILKNAILEILPVIGMLATTFAYRCKTPKSTRLLCLISSPSWLIYNIVNFAVGAICCEVFSLISIIVGLVRIDAKQQTTEK